MSNPAFFSEQFIAVARSFIGTPFRHQGRMPGIGLDCAGLAVAALNQCGLDCDDFIGYGRSPHKGLLKKKLDTQKILKPIICPEPGCILLLKIRHEPQHIAIFTGGTIVHSYETIGRVVEERFTDFWSARLVASYRVSYE